MKKLIFVIFTMVYGLPCMAQQVVLSSEVTVNLPPTAEKLTIGQVSSSEHSNKITLDAIGSNNTAYIYKIQNVLVSFFTESKTVQDGQLLKLKRRLDEMSKKNKTYTSSIETINNNKILVIKEMLDNAMYCRFYCFNNANSAAVTGVLKFDKSEIDNATPILNDILKGIKFTK